MLTIELEDVYAVSRLHVFTTKPRDNGRTARENGRRASVSYMP